MTYDTSGFRNLIRASLLPLSQYSKSKITLSADDAHRIGNLFRLIIDYIRRAFPLKDETLDMLYSVFINDIINIQEFEKVRLPISRRTEEMFVSFYSLVRQNFTEQRSIRFYADRLHVTPTYLSRVVKQVMGQTVMDCIDSMLSMESRWLLTTTNLTVSQIASHLNFSSTAAFDKFYKRMTGTTPLAVRK